MPRTSRWVHGNTVEVEVGVGEKRAVEVLRRGWGTHFLLRDFDRAYWFHFPLPTLSVERDVELWLCRVCVCFSTDGTVVRAIHIYDGAAKVTACEDIRLTGDHSRTSGEYNCWTIEPPIRIRKGVGLSVGVEVVQGGQFGFPEILFTTAGVEFETRTEGSQKEEGGGGEVF